MRSDSTGSRTQRRPVESPLLISADLLLSSRARVKAAIPTLGGATLKAHGPLVTPIVRPVRRAGGRRRALLRTGAVRRAATPAALQPLLRSPPSFPVRVLPLVSQRSVGTLARGRASSARGFRIELRAGARPLRFAIHGGDGAPRALDCGVRRRRHRRQLVGAGQQRQRGHSDVDGRDEGARHPRRLLRGTVRRRSRAELRARCPVPDQELRRSAALGLLPAPRIRGRHQPVRSSSPSGPSCRTPAPTAMA